MQDKVCAPDLVLLFMSNSGVVFKLDSVINSVVGRSSGFFCATAAAIFSKIFSFNLLNTLFSVSGMSLGSDGKWASLNLFPSEDSPAFGSTAVMMPFSISCSVMSSDGIVLGIIFRNWLIS